jgi:hypothetical protein
VVKNVAIPLIPPPITSTRVQRGRNDESKATRKPRTILPPFDVLLTVEDQQSSLGLQRGRSLRATPASLHHGKRLETWSTSWNIYV